MNKDWEIVIGIEIHLELNTKTKMFSPALNSYGNEPNTSVTNIDLAYPGALPLVNSAAIIKGIKLAKALHMTIDKLVRFDRKNYFYPDLTKGYQITQQFNPIGKDGSIQTKVNGQWKEVLIERIHLEEDTAKSLHESQYTYLNYNRAGVPLIEIVSRPVIHSAEEAIVYIEAIRQTALVLNISDAKMNEGSLRTDINISVRKKGTNDLNTRVEIKNLNSLSNVEKAINYEANYQVQCYLEGKTFEQETKRFDEATETTISMRSKSDSVDYKYFPDPNLPYINLSDELVDSVIIEEIPYDKEIRYVASGLNQVQISQLLNNVEYSKYLDAINAKDFKKSANIFFADIVSYINQNNKNIATLSFTPQDAQKLINFVIDNKINKADIKKIIEAKDNSDDDLIKIIESHDLFIKEMSLSLDEVINAILKENPDLEEEFKRNYQRASKFMLGQAMKKTMGKANVAELNKKLAERFQ
ncbi:Asp-tRNA(Asn)/Glu-tRNA(Gln) amidotransferase subunit GatB [Metamycoplasma neophronis]|uniref:Aspartyl/glutamyl-tRNA(Asn/Gln) amidotransferase subunit B n=1 Tax=Metamycoplasma neophronis TaxID=872983 RepID=A0ABY2Z0A3_9BACT|nr:Asp-tRNA(Asn)/Glu-tRNA(Gln) amidotransferase subunit GatB [Metamycoplasma neophronis]TPR54310.1 Asp-tRNA(Asn)/Glu-tRNA(Gln) amidotransferase subunit GatB [Metamycoplasma neophronis]